MRLPLEPADTKRTYVARVAALFQSQPNVWIPGMKIAPIGGIYAWRTRISDCRNFPFSLDIRNRQRRVRRPDGSSYVISEYMAFMEEMKSGEGATDGASTSSAAV